MGCYGLCVCLYDCMRVCVCAGLGVGTLRAGWGWGCQREQNRSLQNLPSQGGWSWVGQAGTIPGFRRGTRMYARVYVCQCFVSGFGGYPPH